MDEYLLPVRTKWPHEARHFTPWLAKNLDRLAGVLGLEIHLVQTEEQVGPYFLDILARETGTNRLVAIENQLDWTDLTHLGQLLTYATGCGARIAIWVAGEFQYEHAQTLNRLNQWTENRIEFYGVKIELEFYGVKIELVQGTDDSEPEPRFRKVVWPDGWDKSITLESNPPRGAEYEAYFRPLIAELRYKGFDEPFKRWDHSDRSFRSRVDSRILYYVSFEKGNSAWVSLVIDTSDRNLTNQIFDALKVDRAEIESAEMATSTGIGIGRTDVSSPRSTYDGTGQYTTLQRHWKRPESGCSIICLPSRKSSTQRSRRF